MPSITRGVRILFHTRVENRSRVDNYSDKEVNSPSDSTTPSPPTSFTGRASQTPPPMSSSSSVTLPAPRRTTNIPCRLCNQPSTLLVTRYSERSNNGGRPYYKCLPCKKFLTFADERGIIKSNPRCHCNITGGSSSSSNGWQEGQGRLSRLQMNRKEHPRLPRGLHYVCATGGCNFYQEVMEDNEQGWPRRQMAVPEQLVKNFARLGII